MTTINKIYAHEIIDSRGYPTLEGVLILDSGVSIQTSVPVTYEKSKYGAEVLVDENVTRLEGNGVQKAVGYVNDLVAPRLKGVDVLRQKDIDAWLLLADGTKNKSRLGANVTLLVSQLLAKAGAHSQRIPIFRYLNSIYNQWYTDRINLERVPIPVFNVINGGRHANNSIEFQELLMIPSSSLNFEKAYMQGIELYHDLKNVLAYRGAYVSVGEEGGFSPNFNSNIDALEIMVELFNKHKLRNGLDIFLGIDIAADYFYKDERYVLKDMIRPLKRDEYIEYLLHLINVYSLLVVEDPLAQDDWEGWKKLSSKLSENVYVIGDNFLSGNTARFKKSLEEKACSTVSLKPIEIGTVSEVMQLVQAARSVNASYVVSHCLGETDDTFIADLAVAVQADFVKFGAPSRGERVVKYNRLWTIEREEFTQK